MKNIILLLLTIFISNSLVSQSTNLKKTAPKQKNILVEDYIYQSCFYSKRIKPNHPGNSPSCNLNNYQYKLKYIFEKRDNVNSPWQYAFEAVEENWSTTSQWTYFQTNAPLGYHLEYNKLYRVTVKEIDFYSNGCGVENIQGIYEWEEFETYSNNFHSSFDISNEADYHEFSSSDLIKITNLSPGECPQYDYGHIDIEDSESPISQGEGEYSYKLIIKKSMNTDWSSDVTDLYDSGWITNSLVNSYGNPTFNTVLYNPSLQTPSAYGISESCFNDVYYSVQIRSKSFYGSSIGSETHYFKINKIGCDNTINTIIGTATSCGLDFEPNLFTLQNYWGCNYDYVNWSITFANGNPVPMGMNLFDNGTSVNIKYGCTFSPGPYLLTADYSMNNNECSGTAISEFYLSVIPGSNGIATDGTEKSNDTMSGDPSVVNVYPNPSKNFVVIEFESLEENASFRIYDAMGKIVMSDNVKRQNDRIDISGLPEGMYLLKIENGESEIMKSIIKN